MGLRALALAMLLTVPARADDAAPPSEPDTAADEAPPDPTAPAEGDELIIYGEREVARRRAMIERDLRDMGYKAKDRDGYTVYRPETPWYPSVYVYDAGYVMVRRSPPRFEPYIKGTSNLRYLACIPPFTVMCIQMSGVMITDRKLEPLKYRVVTALDPEVDAWQDALVSQGMEHRLLVEVPTLLQAAWETGAPLEPQSPALLTPADRKAAILAFWASRADTPEGEAVRDAVETFLSEVVQASPWPVTAAEALAASTSCACGRTPVPVEAAASP